MLTFPINPGNFYALVNLYCDFMITTNTYLLPYVTEKGAKKDEYVYTSGILC